MLKSCFRRAPHRKMQRLPPLRIIARRQGRRAGASSRLRSFTSDGPKISLCCTMSKMDLDVSVIVPTYHRERELLDAINSVRSQTGVAFEIIVVDDSPEGSARDTVASVNDPRVRYVLRPDPSKGRPAKVRNDGAKLARGRYLYFLDDDDMLEAGTLAELSRALDAAPGAGMAFGVISPFGVNEDVLR